jgi:hypothetical protein
VLEGKQEHFTIGTLGQVYTGDDIASLKRDDVMAPPSYRPVFNFTN